MQVCPCLLVYMALLSVESFAVHILCLSNWPAAASCLPGHRPSYATHKGNAYAGHCRVCVHVQLALGCPGMIFALVYLAFTVLCSLTLLPVCPLLLIFSQSFDSHAATLEAVSAVALLALTGIAGPEAQHPAMARWSVHKSGPRPRVPLRAGLHISIISLPLAAMLKHIATFLSVACIRWQQPDPRQMPPRPRCLHSAPRTLLPCCWLRLQRLVGAHVSLKLLVSGHVQTSWIAHQARKFLANCTQ